MSLGGLEPALHLLGVGSVIEPGEIGGNEGPGRLPGGQRRCHGAPQVRLEPRLDGALGGPAGGLQGRGMLKHPAGDVGRRLQRPDKGAPLLPPGRLDDAGECRRVPVDEPEALPPDAAQPPRGSLVMDELFQQGSRQCGGQRGDAASSEPGPPAGDMFYERFQRVQRGPRQTG